jgi:hypothetical protein
VIKCLTRSLGEFTSFLGMHSPPILVSSFLLSSFGPNYQLVKRFYIVNKTDIFRVPWPLLVLSFSFLMVMI